MTTITRPSEQDYAPYYRSYVQIVPQTADVLVFLGEQGQAVARLVAGLGAAVGDYRYAPGKWSVKQVLGHLADTDRVFTFRAAWFARGEQAPLPGMDENLWAENAGADGRDLADLGRELAFGRQSSLSLFASLTEQAWRRQGVASGRMISVAALPWIIAGHERHHLDILAERYGIVAARRHEG